MIVAILRKTHNTPIVVVAPPTDSHAAIAKMLQVRALPTKLRGHGQFFRE